MKLNGADVIAFWGGLNAVPAAIIVYYRGEQFPSVELTMYGADVLLIEVIAGAAFLTVRRQRATTLPATRGSHLGLLLGLIAVFVIAGLTFGEYMAIPAVYPAVAVVIELIARRAVPPTERPSLAPAPSEAPRPAAAAEKGPAHRRLATAAVMAIAAVAVRRRRTRDGGQ